MARQSRASQDGIEAASATYNKCTRMLQEELGLKPFDLGLGPRASFEETVTLLRAFLQRQTGHHKAHLEELTTDDFSFNEILRLMRLTAMKLGQPNKLVITREEFIREVNKVLQEEGGLKMAKRLSAGAVTGRYAWIEGHMQTFLRRHRDVVRLSKKLPDCLTITIPRSGRRKN